MFLRQSSSRGPAIWGTECPARTGHPRSGRGQAPLSDVFFVIRQLVGKPNCLFWRVLVPFATPAIVFCVIQTEGVPSMTVGLMHASGVRSCVPLRLPRLGVGLLWC